MPSSRTSLAPHRDFRRRVLARDKAAGVTHCPECGVELDYTNTRNPDSAEPDHIVPVAQGGTNATSNGRTICRECNQRLGGKTRQQPQTANSPEPVIPSPIW